MSNTPNFAMPLLFAAQAQKEITHNEALTLIDALLARCVEAVTSDPALLTPQEGMAWIIGPSPVGSWAGRGRQIAFFSSGGWRFAPAVRDMRLYDRSAGVERIFDGAAWIAPPAITDPTGGGMIDSEARAVLVMLLVALRKAGMLAAT